MTSGREQKDTTDSRRSRAQILVNVATESPGPATRPPKGRKGGFQALANWNRKGRASKLGEQEPQRTEERHGKKPSRENGKKRQRGGRGHRKAEELRTPRRTSQKRFKWPQTRKRRKERKVLNPRGVGHGRRNGKQSLTAPLQVGETGKPPRRRLIEKKKMGSLVVVA